MVGSTRVDFSGEVISNANNTVDEKVEESDNTTQESDEGAKVNIVTDFDIYQGDTLEEKIDSFIESHPVVMFNRTWCLFSVDAQNFLVLQMNVTVHSVEVDMHPQGKEILKYVYEKTKYRMTPVIFIKGDFLGGFEEVNSLYAQGKLEGEYLKGLSHADRCEVFISKAKLKAKPFFWFPEKVDGNVVRITGVLTFVISFLSVIFVYFENVSSWGRYLAYFLAIEFLLRLLAGARISFLGRLAMLFTKPFDPNPRAGRPKQFAAVCGIVFSWLASIFYLVTFPGHEIVGSVFIGGLTVASFMEGFLDYCIGCVIFRLLVKVGIFGK